MCKRACTYLGDLMEVMHQYRCVFCGKDEREWTSWCVVVWDRPFFFFLSPFFTGAILFSPISPQPTTTTTPSHHQRTTTHELHSHRIAIALLLSSIRALFPQWLMPLSISTWSIYVYHRARLSTQQRLSHSRWTYTLGTRTPAEKSKLAGARSSCKSISTSIGTHLYSCALVHKETWERCGRWLGTYRGQEDEDGSYGEERRWRLLLRQKTSVSFQIKGDSVEARKRRAIIFHYLLIEEYDFRLTCLGFEASY